MKNYAFSLIALAIVLASFSGYALSEYNELKSQFYASLSVPSSGPGAYSASLQAEDRRLDLRFEIDDLVGTIRTFSIPIFAAAIGLCLLARKKAKSAVRKALLVMAVLSAGMLFWSTILGGGIGFDEVALAWFAAAALYFALAVALFVKVPSRISPEPRSVALPDQAA